MAGARILDASDEAAVEEAAKILTRGGLVAFPTETVYGLGADAENRLSVARIFEVKRRPSMDPLIVHLADPSQAEHYGDLGGLMFGRLVERFWPGPLTLVVPRRPTVPAIVTAGLDTVALRMPAHGAALSFLRAVARGVAAPSANPFGYVSPTTAEHVADQLGDRIDVILDGGPCRVGIESTVLSIAGSAPVVLRTGGISIEELESVLGRVALVSGKTPVAPGQFPRHYSTRTPLVICDPDSPEARPSTAERVGLLSLRAYGGPWDYAVEEVLSNSGDLREAAVNLFAALRRLDGLRLDRIVAFPVPERDLGTAIMDRLRRCSAGPDSRSLESLSDSAHSP